MRQGTFEYTFLILVIRITLIRGLRNGKLSSFLLLITRKEVLFGYHNKEDVDVMLDRGLLHQDILTLPYVGSGYLLF